VGQKGVAVTPYAITRVTANGQVIYQHEVDTSQVLVAPYVAAQMTDLLQTAVNTGTGRAAQIGRPVAGKTGTTTSNKDGWFLGFSSGLTTGVWMGRDDAKAVPGLQGGTAPARAFQSFMAKAVAKRPAEKFETEVTLPEWQLEPDEEAYFGSPDNGMMVDPDGNPIGDPVGDLLDQQGEPPPRETAPPADPGKLDQEWMDRVLDRQPQRAPQRESDRAPAGGLRQPPQDNRPRDEPY
jgi:penicillin-binding protein 1A